MNRDRSYLAHQREFFERMVMEAVKLEDAFVEGKNCTTQKQRERREYRKHQRTLARQREAMQLLKVEILVLNLNSAVESLSFVSPGLAR